VREQLPRHDAREVKLIGDAIMLRVAHAADAIRLGLTIVRDVGSHHGAPTVRVGMHSGPAVERSGDFYGSTVNVAARVAGVAAGGEVLLTATTKQAAGTFDDIELEPRGPRSFKNVAQPVVIYAAVSQDRGGNQQWLIDPVCRMAVDPARRAGVLIHRGKEYSFCSMTCAHAFAESPERYTTAEEA
jgi:class 3 adenylate cyclase/YHS domain-containing protein